MTTPVARNRAEVESIAAQAAVSMDALDTAVTGCRACPRLVAWREQVAGERRAAFRDEEYWGRPVPGFGPPDARVVVLGLAPAAHGANRTGRVFTGDRSGDWLFAALHRAGMANQATATGRGDGLALRDTRVLAAVRCAPPANKPTPTERDTCAPWLDAELALLAPTMRVLVVLGGFAWDVALAWHARTTGAPVRPKPRFTHGATARFGPLTMIASYHPSQQNTFTGRLTEAMLDDVLAAARLAAGSAESGTMGP